MGARARAGKAKAPLTGERKQVRLNAWVDPDLRRSLYHALLDDGLDFSKWLRKQIEEYLSARKGGSAARRSR